MEEAVSFSWQRAHSQRQRKRGALAARPAPSRPPPVPLCTVGPGVVAVSLPWLLAVHAPPAHVHPYGPRCLTLPPCTPAWYCRDGPGGGAADVRLLAAQAVAGRCVRVCGAPGRLGGRLRAAPMAAAAARQLQGSFFGRLGGRLRGRQDALGGRLRGSKHQPPGGAYGSSRLAAPATPRQHLCSAPRSRPGQRRAPDSAASLSPRQCCKSLIWLCIRAAEHLRYRTLLHTGSECRAQSAGNLSVHPCEGQEQGKLGIRVTNALKKVGKAHGALAGLCWEKTLMNKNECVAQVGSHRGRRSHAACNSST